MKIIGVIGFSGSGKTWFISNAIKLINSKLNYNITVIKNVKHHQIDEKGKDSDIFTNSGANYSIIKNQDNQMAIFLKLDESNLNTFINWLDQGPYRVDLVFFEGFRNLNHPTVLCVSSIDEIEPQKTKNVKMISGTICVKEDIKNSSVNLPLINIEENFQKFLEIFNIA